MYNVIEKLNRGDGFICFRESKLTRILQPYLGGNSLTTIICNINPLQSNYQESVNTLRFALCAGGIKNNIRINVRGERRYDEIERMQDELERIEGELKIFENKKEEKKIYKEKLLKEKLEFEENVQKMGQELISVKNQKEVLLEEFKIMSSELEQLKEANLEESARLNDYNNKLLSLKNENIIEEISKVSLKLSTESDILSNENRDLQKELFSLSNFYKEKNQTLNELNDKIFNLKNKNEFLQETNSMLSNSITPDRKKIKRSLNPRIKASEIQNISKKNILHRKITNQRKKNFGSYNNYRKAR